MLRLSARNRPRAKFTEIGRKKFYSAKTSSPSSIPQSHTSLPTFLAYARSAPLSPKSAVYAGTYYEYLCLSTLSRLGFSLSRTGGRSDQGIDLIGTWSLPSIPPCHPPLKCLIQCKASKSKITPDVVRELEGSFAGAPAGFLGEEVVSVLCAKREATKGVREAVRRSKRPVVWVMLEDLGGEEGTGGKVRQMLWNQRVSDLGAEGVGVGVKYSPGEKEGVEKEVVLTWRGEVWEPEGSSGGEKEDSKVD
ncbi:MAG: hypothetical protein Q9212_007011 [Teloschistes hypoglaucus]